MAESNNESRQLSEALAGALSGLADRFVRWASQDELVRQAVRRLAEAVLEATAPAETGPEVPASPVAAEEPPADLDVAEREIPVAAVRPLVAAADEPREEEPEAPGPLPELTLGRAAPVAEPARSYPTRWSVTTSADIPLIEARCRLKAEGARWAGLRRRLLADGADYAIDIAPRDRDIISRAKSLPDCFLWMCHPSGPSPADLRGYEIVAGCFDALAEALSLLKQVLDEPECPADDLEALLDLLAEAQSALRVAVAGIDGHADSDQTRVFNWLKATASERQIFVRRYMRADDPADPSRWSDLMARLEAFDLRIQAGRKQVRVRRKLLGKIRHKLSLIDEDTEGAPEHWRVVASAVDELVNDGLPPSNRELRELLVPAVDSMPEIPDLPAGFEAVLREIDRFLATCPSSDEIVAPRPTAEVQEVSRLLRGRSLILIGGVRRRASQQALEQAFQLRELIWIEGREHQSIDAFEPYVARPDVAVVLLAIRWSSHSFGDVRDFCDRYGKALVRLPAGYNPNQVAAQIMAQCSGRLAAG